LKKAPGEVCRGGQSKEGREAEKIGGYVGKREGRERTGRKGEGREGTERE